MKRDIYDKLLSWKVSENRKPLVLQGARQVGKTYIIKEFGSKEYSNVAYFNFEEDKGLVAFFDGVLDPLSIIEKLSIASESKINPNATLIIFDEIQEAPAALTSLKYFCELANEYHVIASGSLLGISLGQERSFPVGKVNILHLYPLSFIEFLSGIGKPLLAEMLENKNDFTNMDNKFHQELLNDLKMFMFIGGMPEAINVYNKSRDLDQVRQVHQEILLGYESDFAKHTSKAEAIKLRQVWDIVPSQLAKENKKFVFSEVKKHARPRDFNEAIEWLLKCGLVYKSYRVNMPELPLNGYIEENVFKLFCLDSGLLGAMLDLTAKTIVAGSKLFSRFNGAFTENYIAQELTKVGFAQLYYWTSGNMAEIDFLVPYQEHVYPLEVKSGFNPRSRSLSIYLSKYQPEFISRTSLLNFAKNNEYRDYPLYAISLFPLEE